MRPYRCLILTKLGRIIVNCSLHGPPIAIKELTMLVCCFQQFAGKETYNELSLEMCKVVIYRKLMADFIVALVVSKDSPSSSYRLLGRAISTVFEALYIKDIKAISVNHEADTTTRLNSYRPTDVSSTTSNNGASGGGVSDDSTETMMNYYPFEKEYLRPVLSVEQSCIQSWLGSPIKKALSSDLFKAFFQCFIMNSQDFSTVLTYSNDQAKIDSGNDLVPHICNTMPQELMSIIYSAAKRICSKDAGAKLSDNTKSRRKSLEPFMDVDNIRNHPALNLTPPATTGTPTKEGESDAATGRTSFITKLSMSVLPSINQPPPSSSPRSQAAGLSKKFSMSNMLHPTAPTAPKPTDHDDRRPSGLSKKFSMNNMLSQLTNKVMGTTEKEITPSALWKSYMNSDHKTLETCIISADISKIRQTVNASYLPPLVRRRITFIMKRVETLDNCVVVVAFDEKTIQAAMVDDGHYRDFASSEHEPYADDGEDSIYTLLGCERYFIPRIHEEIYASIAAVNSEIDRLFTIPEALLAGKAEGGPSSPSAIPRRPAPHVKESSESPTTSTGNLIVGRKEREEESNDTTYKRAVLSLVPEGNESYKGIESVDSGRLPVIAASPLSSASGGDATQKQSSLKGEGGLQPTRPIKSQKTALRHSVNF